MQLEVVVTKNTILSITLDKALYTSALIFVHSLCWKPSHHMHFKMSSVAGLEQVLHKVSLAFLLSFSGDELDNCFVFPACICVAPLALILQFLNDEHLPNIHGKQNKPATSNRVLPIIHSTIHELKVK